MCARSQASFLRRKRSRSCQQQQLWLRRSHYRFRYSGQPTLHIHRRRSDWARLGDMRLRVMEGGSVAHGRLQIGRGEQRDNDSGEEDEQSKQNAEIQESRLSSVFLFH